jgi:hypothetical protein
MLGLPAKHRAAMQFGFFQLSQDGKVLRKSQAGLRRVRVMLDCCGEVEHGSIVIAPIALTTSEHQELIE